MFPTRPVDRCDDGVLGAALASPEAGYSLRCLGSCSLLLLLASLLLHLLMPLAFPLPWVSEFQRRLCADLFADESGQASPECFARFVSELGQGGMAQASPGFVRAICLRVGGGGGGGGQVSPPELFD